MVVVVVVVVGVQQHRIHPYNKIQSNPSIRGRMYIQGTARRRVLAAGVRRKGALARRLR